MSSLIAAKPLISILSLLRQHRTHVFFLFVGALAIRLIALNQSLWLDEAITARVIQNFSPFELMRIFSPNDFHPPLHYLLLQAWSHIFGTSEIALRFPSVLASLLAGWCIYFTVKIRSSAAIAWWSAAFFLFNPLVVYFSQEARMYSLLTLFVAANIFFLQRLLLPSTQKRDWFGFISTIMLGLWTFYGVVFYLGALAVFLLWRREWKILFASIAAGGLGLVLIFPLFWQQLIFSQTARSLVPNWTQVLGTASFKNLLLIPIKLLSGRLSFEPKFLYFLLAGGWTAVSIFSIFLGLRKQPWIGIFLIVPVGLGLVFSLFTPLLQYFRFLFLVIFVALALGQISSSWWKKILLVGFLSWSLATVLVSQFYRENWKELAVQVSETKLPVAMILSSSDPLLYYFPEQEIIDIREVSNESPDILIVLPYSVEIHGVDSRNILQSNGYTLDAETSLRGLSWEEWKRETTPASISDDML